MLWDHLASSENVNIGGIPIIIPRQVNDCLCSEIILRRKEISSLIAKKKPITLLPLSCGKLNSTNTKKVWLGQNLMLNFVMEWRPLSLPLCRNQSCVVKVDRCSNEQFAPNIGWRIIYFTFCSMYRICRPKLAVCEKLIFRVHSIH